MSRKKRGGDDDNGFEEWGGYMGAKMQKLQQQFRADAAKNNPYSKSNLFAGVSIHVNGLTNPSADELKRIMMTHGGTYDTYHRSGVTKFIVAQNLPDVKIRALIKSKSRLIISPDWIVDCVREMRILDYSRYLLYTNERTNQPTIGFKRVELKDDVKCDNFVNSMMVPEYLENTQKEPSSQNNNGFESFFADEDEDMFADDDTLSGETIPKLETQQATSGNSELASILKDLEVLNEQIRLCNRNSDPPVNQLESKLISAVNEAKPEPKSNSSKQALTAIDPNFLAEFYNNSRLHHISTLGTGFKSHISALREASDGSFPGRTELCHKFKTNSIQKNPSMKSKIMHIDMDCFFVSVGLRNRPHLRGQPVAVTHSKGGATRSASRPGADPERERAMYEERRGISTENRMETKTLEMMIEGSDSLAEIASCSYEARRMGLKNGMFVGAALKLCPNLKTIPYDFDQYKDVAHKLYNTVAKYTLDIEAVSCDEMYVDLGKLLRTTGVSAEDFVTHIRAEIQTLTGCPCSAGIGANRLQARMATKRAKPDGQFFLAEDEVEEYFGAIVISDLPGVGYSTTQKLNQLGWKLCEDLRGVPLVKLQTELGKKLGETLQQYSQGIDAKPLVFGQIRKSVSAEVNYGIRFAVEGEFDAFLQQLCTEVHSRLTEIRHRGKTITLKLMVRSADAPIETAKFMGHGVCDNVTKTSTLTEFTCDAEVIRRTVFALKSSMAVDPKELRGVGIQIGKLDGGNCGIDKSETAGRLKAMFEVAAQKIEARRTEPVEMGFEVIDPQRRVPRNLRTVEPKVELLPDTVPRAKRGRKRGSGSGPSTSRAIGRGTTKQPSVTDLLGVDQRTVDGEDSNPDSQIDMAVLAELPDDIREEALRDFRLQRQTAKRQKIIKLDPISINDSGETPGDELDPEFLAALPDDIRAELVRERAVRKQREQREHEASAYADKEQQASVESADEKPTPVKPKEPTSEGNVFVSDDWRRTLQDWVNSVDGTDNCPLQSDIETIAAYAEELARLRLINELYLRFRYFFRIVAEKRKCCWHRAYYHIVNVMQQEMMRTYRSRLQVQEHFNCLDCVTSKQP